MSEWREYRKTSIDLDAAKPAVKCYVEQALADPFSSNNIFIAAGVEEDEALCGYQTPNTQAVARLIFESLFSIYQGTPQKEHPELFNKIYETFFCDSVGPFNSLSISDKLWVIAQIEDRSEMSDLTLYFLEAMAEDLDLFSSTFAESVRTEIELFSPIEKLRILRLLKKIAVTGEEDQLFLNFHQNLAAINERIRDNSPEAFFQFICDEINQFMHSEGRQITVPWSFKDRITQVIDNTE